MEELQLHLHVAHEANCEKPGERCMLFHRTERNQRGIFRKMLKRVTVVSTTGIDIRSGRFMKGARGI